MSLAPSFPSLPAVGSDSRALSPDEILIRSGAYDAKGFSAETLAAIERAKIPSVDSLYYSTGVFVSDLGTKALEGAKDIANRFTGNIPFLKLGAKTPTFADIANSAAGIPGVSAALDPTSRAALFDKTIPGTSATATNAVLKNEQAEEDRSHLITLTNSITGEVIEFLVMPEVVENRGVEYEAVAPAQFPGAFQKYKGTQSVQWTLNSTFVSRTTNEATTNLQIVNQLRAWTMPYFGENTRINNPNRLGAPPPVLKLKGLRKGMIGEVPVVITSLSWNWPRDVDYIPAYDISDTSEGASTANIPFPTVLQIAIQLVESFSTVEFNQFNLSDYRVGNMVGAYGARLTANNATEQNPVASQLPQEQEAQFVSGTGIGQGAVDARRLDQAIPVAGAGRGIVNPASVVPAISERATALYNGVSNIRLPISDTAISGNVQDLSLG